MIHENWEPRVRAELSAKALLSNLGVILDQVPGLWAIPMIKANAYGHGALWAARQLIGEPGVRGLGVATLEEGKDLRKELGQAGKRTSIFVFSGAIPWTESKGQFCERHHLTPILASQEDWSRFFREGWHTRIPYELKFNTGMNRLGIPVSFVRSLAKTLKNEPIVGHPAGILTHLAMGENPNAKLSILQLERYQALRSELSSVIPRAQFHLANSAAIWNSKYWQLKSICDGVRPGISLYGIPPWPGAPVRGLIPVIQVCASVIAIHTLKPGESVGYGASFTVPTRGQDARPMRVAIIGAGYADGLHRALSGKGMLWTRSRSVKLLGRVSMDMAAIECTQEARLGDRVEWLGSHIDLWKQAEEAGTHPYEILTSIGSRVQRNYV